MRPDSPEGLLGPDDGDPSRMKQDESQSASLTKERRDRIVAEIEACRGYLAVLARSLIPNDKGGPERASDLEQRTITAALENIRDGRLPRDPSLTAAWLTGILKNLFRAEFRKQRPEVGLDADRIEAPTATPSGRAADGELLSRMAEARDRLESRDRLILKARLEEDLTFDEIGGRLGISAPAAHKAYRVALERLTEAFFEIAAEKAYKQSVESIKSAYQDHPPNEKNAEERKRR